MDGTATVDLEGNNGLEGLDSSKCQVVLTSEDRPFAIDPQPIHVELSGSAPVIRFARPSAVLLRSWPVATEE